MKPYFDSGDGIALHLGKCEDVLPTIPDASVDAVVCDPPYNLPGGFMGAQWDNIGPGRQFQDWCETWARECLRVLKPGGHLLAFGAPRTYHRMACAIEDAGFEIRDSIHWVYGTGFPKGQDIGKAIDRRRDDRADVLRVCAWLRETRDAAGWTAARIDALFGFNGMASHWTAREGKAAIVPTLDQWAVLRDALGFDDTEILPLVEQLNGRKGEIGEAWERREVVGKRHSGLSDGSTSVFLSGATGRDGDGMVPVTVAASEAAKRWEGWNSALKPAHEPIVVARKSTGFNTTVANVLEHGTGAINVDACRTTGIPPSVPQPVFGSPTGRTYAMKTGEGRTGEMSQSSLGRWPTNLLLTHSPDCEQVGVRTVRGDSRAGQQRGMRPGGFGDVGAESGSEKPNGTLHGPETVEAFRCAPGCPVAEMDRQSGVTTSSGGSGLASGRPGQDVYGTYSQRQRQGKNAGGLGDQGGASRFFPVFRYEPKAPASERPRLADGTAHTTVKPLELMRWLVRLVTPPGGTVLDPMAGSGTTLEACVLEGFGAIGIEREQPHADLCVARLSKPLQPSLFGDLGDAA